MTVYTNNLRQFAGKTMLIKEVYTAYRAGGVETNGKFVFKSFYQFPIIDDEEIAGDDPRAKEASDKKEWREKVFNNGKLSFVKLDKDIKWKEWFKIYKKVFDINVELEQSENIHRYKEVYDDGDVAVIQGVSSSKVKDMIDALTEFEVPLMKGKLRDGTEGMVAVYDYEDDAKELLKGVGFAFKVAGEGLDTKYTFKSKAFSKKEKAKEEDIFKDLPF